jgi:hypothetical protein
MAQVSASLTRRVIVIFGCGRLQECKEHPMAFVLCMGAMLSFSILYHMGLMNMLMHGGIECYGCTTAWTSTPSFNQ